MKRALALLPFAVLAASCGRLSHATSSGAEPTPGVPTSAHTAAPVATPPAPPAPPTPPPAAPAAPATPPATTPTVAVGGDAFERAVPPLDEATAAHVRQVFQAGIAAHNRADVFAKVGDSITESASFLSDIGHGWYDLGTYSRLDPVVHWFSRRALSADREDNSFSHPSRAATAGWTTEDLLDGGNHCPLEQELNAIHPAFAILMVGTNDAVRGGLPNYERNLNALLDRIEAHHTVALMSTIPDEPNPPGTQQAIESLNGIIHRTAATRHLPLIDYHLALEGLPNHGLSDDQIHPGAYVENQDTKATVFTPPALAFGYNVRNLTALMMFDRVFQLLALH